MHPALEALRLAWRALLRSPGVFLTCIAALGLAVGASTAIFAFVDKLLLDPFPFPQERLVMVLEASPERDRQPVPAALVESWSAQPRTFTRLATYAWWDVNLTGVNEPEHLVGYKVSPDLFDVLGVAPALGRAFTAADGRPGGEKVVILSHALWQRRFGGDPGIVGRNVLLDGLSYTVVGVTGPGFRFPKAASLWVPLPITDQMRAAVSSHFCYVLGRLAPGASIASVQSELEAISARFDEAQPAHRAAAHRPQVFALRDYGDPQTRLILWLVAAAVGMIVILACANVANVLLARSIARAREFAVRIALGAPRHRIVLQLLAESVILAVGACTAGLILGQLGIRLLRAGMPPNVERFVAGWDRVGLDWRLFGFSAVASLLAALLSASYSAVQASRQSPHQTLVSDGPAATGSPQRHRLRSTLVLLQAALALVLVNDAGLFAGTLRRMLDAPLGFDPGHLLTFRVGVAETLAPGDADVVRMLEEAIRNTRAVPGVEQVAVANAVPLSNRWASTAFEPEGTAPPVDGRAPRALLQSISDGYLEALRIPLRQGRAFGSADGRSSLDVALISEPLARKYFPGGDALGARIRIGTRWRTVVGVVGAVKHTEIADPGVAIYLPLAQAPVREVAFAVRTAGAPLSAASAIREAVHAALPDQPISDLAPMRTVVDDNALLAARYAAGMLGVLGAIALMLSAVGIYGVVAQWVVQRLRELGIRSALGARRRQLMGLVVSRSLRPAAVGLVLGLGLSLAHGRALRAALYGVSPNDPLTLTTVALFLGLVATAACLIPAGRALGQDPAAILRHE